MEFIKHYREELTVRSLPSDYDFAEMEGFQPGQSEPIEVLIRRLSRGDTTVIAEAVTDDEYPFDSYPDSFEIMDKINEMSERSSQAKQQPDSESSASEEPEQPIGDAQGSTDKPGDSEIEG